MLNYFTDFLEFGILQDLVDAFVILINSNHKLCGPPRDKSHLNILINCDNFLKHLSSLILAPIDPVTNILIHLENFRHLELRKHPLKLLNHLLYHIALIPIILLNLFCQLPFFFQIIYFIFWLKLFMLLIIILNEVDVAEKIGILRGHGKEVVYGEGAELRKVQEGGAGHWVRKLGVVKRQKLVKLVSAYYFIVSSWILGKKIGIFVVVWDVWEKVVVFNMQKVM